MAKFLNAVLFTPTAGGTTDFTVSAAVQGYQVPNAAGAVNGAVYRYRAESAALNEWEIGYGTYNTGTGVLTRTVVLYNSLGTTAKINFAAAPNVAMGMPLATDVFATIDTVAPTDPANGAIWWKSDTGVLYVWDGSAWQLSTPAVLYTAQALTRAQQQQARANIGVASKNYIINGGMQISQENGTAAVSLSNSTGYPVDQFCVESANAGVLSAAQVASTTPAGSPNRLRCTVTTADAAVGAADYAIIYQRIEGLLAADLCLGKSSARTVTVQFGVKAPAGTYCVGLRNSASNRAYAAEYTISAGEANTDVVKSVTIALDQTGTWLTDTGVGLFIGFSLMAGSNFQGTPNTWVAAGTFATSNQFNFMGTNGNVFELFDVGMYEGSAAPTFQLQEFEDELRKCKRYWRKSYEYSTAPASASKAGIVSCGMNDATGTGAASISFDTPMRIAPTIAFWDGAGNANKISYLTINSSVWNDNSTTGVAPFNASQNGFTASGPNAVAHVQGFIHYTANARM